MAYWPMSVKDYEAPRRNDGLELNSELWNPWYDAYHIHVYSYIIYVNAVEGYTCDNTETEI